jgi:hypothetical protein
LNLPTRRRAYREFVWCLTSGWEDFTLAAIRREERKLEKQLVETKRLGAQ